MSSPDIDAIHAKYGWPECRESVAPICCAETSTGVNAIVLYQGEIEPWRPVDLPDPWLGAALCLSFACWVFYVTKIVSEIHNNKRHLAAIKRGADKRSPTDE